MSTEQTHTATTAGALTAEVISHVGRINVIVDAAAKNASVRVHTTDTEGPIADAVRDTTIDESGGTLRVRVPQTGGTVVSGGGVQNFVSVGGNSFSFTGNVGTVMSGNDIWIGGQKVVSNGRVVAQQGTTVGSVGNGTVTVDLVLPPASSLRTETTSADTRITGDLKRLDAHSVSGDVEAQGVEDFIGDTTSGDVEIRRATGAVAANSVSGDLEIRDWSGDRFRANSVSGDFDITVTDFREVLTVSTVSGDLITRGAQRPNTRFTSVSGRERHR